MLGHQRGEEALPYRFTSMPELLDLKNRSENSAEREHVLSILQVNSCSIDQKSSEICTSQADLQPIPLSPTGC